MKSLKLRSAFIAMTAIIFLTVNTQAQDKMSKMKKDTSKMSRMDHKKMDHQMGKMSKMKKDSTGKM